MPPDIFLKRTFLKIRLLHTVTIETDLLDLMVTTRSYDKTALIICLLLPMPEKTVTNVRKKTYPTICRSTFKRRRLSVEAIISERQFTVKPRVHFILYKKS